MTKISLEDAEHYKWGDGCNGWHLLKANSLSVIRERMPGGTREIAHLHQKSQQLFYILSGMATFNMGAENYLLSAGQSIHVPNGTIHYISNETTAMLEFLVISQPMAHGDRINVSL